MEYNAAFQKNELDLYRYNNIYDLSFHKKRSKLYNNMYHIIPFPLGSSLYICIYIERAWKNALKCAAISGYFWEMILGNREEFSMKTLLKFL